MFWKLSKLSLYVHLEIIRRDSSPKAFRSFASINASIADDRLRTSPDLITYPLFFMRSREAPAASVVITGRAQAIASLITRPQGSWWVGNTKMSDA